MKSWIMRLLALLAVFALLVPVMAQDEVTLESFTDDTFAIAGVQPADWEELGPGVVSPDGGMTILIQQAAPGATPEQVLDSLLPNLLLSAPPESIEQFVSAGMCISSKSKQGI